MNAKVTMKEIEENQDRTVNSTLTYYPQGVNGQTVDVNITVIFANPHKRELLKPEMTHKSEWGYHNLSKASFDQLAALHTRVWEEYKEYGAHKKNKGYSPLFSKKVPTNSLFPHFHKVSKVEKSEEGSRIHTVSYHEYQVESNMTNIAARIVQAYRDARVPYASKESVPQPLLHPAEIKSLFNQMRSGDGVRNLHKPARKQYPKKE
jgi:hypothetical protein